MKQIIGWFIIVVSIESLIVMMCFPWKKDQVNDHWNGVQKNDVYRGIHFFEELDVKKVATEDWTEQSQPSKFVITIYKDSKVELIKGDQHYETTLDMIFENSPIRVQ